MLKNCLFVDCIFKQTVKQDYWFAKGIFTLFYFKHLTIEYVKESIMVSSFCVVICNKSRSQSANIVDEIVRELISTILPCHL